MRTIAGVGAGIMGTGIAQVCAEAGLQVRLCARRPETLEAARARMARNQAQMRSAGLPADPAALGRVRATTDLAEAVAGADFVSENIPEGIARPEDVDLALEWGLGYRWAAVGPFRVMDLAGLGTFRAVAAQVYPALSRATEPQRLLEDKLARGESGARAGQGFYAYPPGEPERLLALRDARLLALRRALGAEEPPAGA